MKANLRLIGLIAALALTAAACGGDSDTASSDDKPSAAPATGIESFQQPFGDVAAYPVFVNSEIVVGENRFLVGVLNGEDAPIGSPEITVAMDFFDLDASTEVPVARATAEFVPIDEFRGLYMTQATFDAAGPWGAEVTISGEGIDETLRAGFNVAAEPSTPQIGAKVPASDTLTLADAKKLKDVTTDTEPDKRFYKLSIADAIAAKEPFVVAFATPAFCQTATCAPMWDNTKAVVKDYPDLTVIQVEPYDLNRVPQLEPIQATVDWGLPSEPWVFVVDGKGRLVAKFEGALLAKELRSVLNDLT